MSASILFRDVSVFDGHGRLAQGRIEHRDVLVRDGLIQAVTRWPIDPTALAGDTVSVIDGSGRTLLPGLIDSHSHLWAPTATTESAVFGVTTTLDMFSPDGVRPQWTDDTVGIGALADTRTAGLPATVAHGHGTEYGIGTAPVTSAADASRFVETQLTGGADYIKVVCDTTRGDENTMPKETLEAVITAAHVRGVLALAHVTHVEDVAAALSAGADALMHVPVGEARVMLAFSPAALVPTLATLHSGLFPDEPPEILADPAMTPWLSADARDNLSQSWHLPERWTAAAVFGNVRAAYEAGVRILAGTDAGMPGTAHGASLHHELALLVRAGLPPVAALRAATSAPAAFFGLVDRGVIRQGFRADLLLVDGDPTSRISDTRRIQGVWIGGIPVDHSAWTRHLAAEDDYLNTKAAPAAIDAQPPHRWGLLTDAARGGTSTAVSTIVEDDAAEGGRTMQVDTVIEATDGFDVAYAGIELHEGDLATEASFVGREAVSVRARSNDDLTLLVSIDGGYPLKAPVTVPVRLTTDYRTHTIPLGRFGGLDLRRVRSVNFTIATPGRSRVFLNDILLNAHMPTPQKGNVS